MKQFYQDLVTIEPPARPTHDSTEVAGATVKSFLDAADRLHVRITAALRTVGLTWPKFEVLDQLSVGPFASQGIDWSEVTARNHGASQRSDSPSDQVSNSFGSGTHEQ